MAMRGRSTPTVLSEIWIDEGSCGQSQLESFPEDRDMVRLESNYLRHTGITHVSTISLAVSGLE